jgi:hypothetical protein
MDEEEDEMNTWGSIRVTQKLEPHLASSASDLDKFADGRGLRTGSPLTLTWGIAEVSGVWPFVFGTISAVDGAWDAGAVRGLEGVES